MHRCKLLAEFFAKEQITNNLSIRDLITGKKRDDLQSMIELLKSSDIKIPLQFQNFRD